MPFGNKYPLKATSMAYRQLKRDHFKRYVIRYCPQRFIKKYAPKGIKSGSDLIAFAKILKVKESQYLLFAQGLDVGPDMASGRANGRWLYFGKSSLRLAPWAVVGDNDLNIFVDSSKDYSKSTTAPKVFAAQFTKEFEEDLWAQARQ